MKLWIARDKVGYLYLYDKKPMREEDYFDSNDEGKYNTLLHSSYFPEITFENSPQQIDLKLINEK